MSINPFTQLPDNVVSTKHDAEEVVCITNILYS